MTRQKLPVMGQLNSKLTTDEAELCLSKFFDVRRNIVVPNVSWGLKCLKHEADLLIVSPAGWGQEVEIKVSASDLVRDKQKDHGKGHKRSCLVQKLWFAVPYDLAYHKDIPAHAGVIAIVKDVRLREFRAIAIRAPVLDKDARKFTAEELQQLLRLSLLRIWTLKSKLLKHKHLQQKGSQNV